MDNVEQLSDDELHARFTAAALFNTKLSREQIVRIVEIIEE